MAKINIKMKSRRSGVDLREVVQAMFDFNDAITLKPPKRWRSWRVCPHCGSQATKIFSLSTGKYRCQICDHQYNRPSQEKQKRGQAKNKHSVR